MTETRYAADDSAVLLVDFLNDFLAKDGKLAPEIGAMVARLDLKRKYRRLIDGARAAGIKLFYVPHGVDEHSFDDVPRLHQRIQHGVDQRITWIGGWGDDFYPPLKPKAGDLVVIHHRQYNGFIRTDLDAMLKARGIARVVLAGHTSHTCVEGTGRHALEAGYHVTYLKDAVAEFSEMAHQFAVEVSYPTFGHEVLTVDEFLDRTDASKR